MFFAPWIVWAKQLEIAFSFYNIRTRFARHTIVKLKIKSQFDLKLVWKHKNNTYVQENTNRAFQLELVVSQIHLVATRSDPNRSIETCEQQLQRCSAEVANDIQHFVDLHHDEYAYDLAWSELKRRYGQPYVIAQASEERLSAFPKLDRDLADRLNKLSTLMKRCCHALADDKVAPSLDSVSFLTNIANKFTIDLKRKWIKTAVKIRLRCFI